MKVYKMQVSSYNNTIAKRVFDLFSAAFGLMVLSPLIIFVSVLVKLTSEGPVFFVQKRVGKSGKVFRIFKFRTMKKGSERLQNKYLSLNEVTGPVFKIYNDPRLTRFGKVLRRTGLDELPQFVNVIRGEMSIVGPRPLPVNEASKLTKTQRLRELIKPGVTSSWVVGGAHRLSFEKWMELDREYIRTAKFATDLSIIRKTALMIIG